MVDSYVSFSNQNSLDIFPSFKSFHGQKTDQDAFAIDDRDIAEMHKATSNNSVPKPKATNLTLDTIKKSTTNPSVQCDICLVPISSEIVYITHINGRKHQGILTAILTKNPQYKSPTYEELCSKKQEAIVVNNSKQSSSSNIPENDTHAVPSLIPTKQLLCQACNVACNSQQMFDKHLAGKKHLLKLKTNILTNPAPPLRAVVDNNPSSSNYCDVCSLQLKSENELTEHLAQKRHQTKVKEAEICAKAAHEMKINFDDYKILTATTEKNAFQYECIRCNKKMNDKMQLVHHLKSASHGRLATQANKELPPKNPKQGKYQTTQGGPIRSGPPARNYSPSNKPMKQSRTYPPKRRPWNQPSQPYPEQSSENIFGAFDPYNQATYSSDPNPYPSTKHSVPYDDIPSEYDGFFPKHNSAYDNRTTNSGDFSSTHGYDYSQNSDPYATQTTNYLDQSSQSQPPWQYQEEPHYDQQQYSNPPPDYTNSMYYSSTQPPLPDYEPPPVPNYPPPPPEPYYPPNRDTRNPTNNQYYSSSFQY